MNCKVCQKISSKNPDLSFFRFPSDYRRQFCGSQLVRCLPHYRGLPDCRCRDWAKRCDVLTAFEQHGPIKFYKSFRICSDHFDNKYISHDGRKRKLSRTAVPNVFRGRSVEEDADSHLQEELLDDLCGFLAEENSDLVDIYGWQEKGLELEEKMEAFPITMEASLNTILGSGDVEPVIDEESFFEGAVGLDSDKNVTEAEEDRHGSAERKENMFGDSLSENGEDLDKSGCWEDDVTKIRKKLMCGVCLKTFATCEILESHARAHSLQPDEFGRYVCSICDKIFPNKYRLNEHNRVHTGECPFKCSMCDKRFHKRALLKQHSAVHDSEKPFTCFVCNFRSRRKGNLVQHLRTHLKGSGSSTSDKSKTCCLTTGNESNQVHDGDANLDGEQIEEGMDVTFDDAPKAVPASREGSPLDQGKREKKVHRCDECGVDFKRKDTLKNHTRIHTGERPFVCKTCGFAFKQKGDCLKHERNHKKREIEN